MLTLMENTAKILIEEIKDKKDETYDSIHDLPLYLLEDYNRQGYVFVYTPQEREFINENYDEFGYMLDHIHKILDMYINPFTEPHKLHAAALFELGYAILSKTDMFEKISEQSDAQITLDEKTSDELIKQIKDVIESYDIEDII